jgi:uncharacterized protein YyaL (SSP411 family)
MNRLADETSPYLLQHKDNPVDWYPWGEEALTRARDQQKPLLVSIGYSACHWCHVMERESFEDPAVAEVMNEHFVPVKVDREERPDVDAIYMDAVQAMTGHGGWPLNAFLTPDGVPFYAGTYFPPEPRQGMPSWRMVLEGVAKAWDEQRDDIIDGAQRIVGRLQATAQLEAPDAEIDPASLDAAVATLKRSYDAEYGGWGGAPKFPAASTIEFLLRRGERTMALHTLRRMAGGGMYDQVGGSTTTRCSRARTCTPSRSPASRSSSACAARRSTGRCATCARRRVASRARSTPTPRASRASSTSGSSTRCARCSARWPMRRSSTSG